MQSDELKSLWADVDRRLDLRIGQRWALGERKMSAVNAVHWSLWAELIVDAALVLLVGSYLGDNVAAVRFAIPAAVLHVVAIAAIVSIVAQLVALGRSDAGESVVALQSRLERVHLIRARTHRWLLIGAPLLWTPLAIVAAHGLFGVDVYASFGVPWIVANLAFGMLVIVAATLVSRRHVRSARRAGVARKISEAWSGHAVARALAAVREVSAFATEAGSPST